VQVDPIKSPLKAPGTKRLKLEHDNLLSKFAFKFNLRRFTEAWRDGRIRQTPLATSSATFQTLVS